MDKQEASYSLQAFHDAMNRGSFTEAKSIGLNLINDEDIISDSKNHTKILQLLGNASFILSDYHEAISYYNQSIQIYKSIDDTEGIAACLGNMGLVKHRLGEYSDALQYLEQAIEINNKKDGNKRFLAFNLGNVGLVFSSLSDTDKALEYYNRAMIINEDIHNVEGMASTHGNIGLLYQNASDYDKALECFEKTLELYQQLNKKKEIASTYGNIGNIYIHKSELEKALSFHEKAISIYTEVQHQEGLANSYGAIAEIHIKQGQYAKAHEFIQYCLNMAQEIGNQEIIILALLSLSRLHELQHDYEFALQYYKQFTELKDKIQSDESKKQAYLFDQRRKIEEEEKNRQIQFVRMEEQEKLLHSILPVNIAERILNQEQFIADYYPSVSVLFLDIVGFTALSSNILPKHLIYILDTIFTKADEIIDQHGLEKIKTIGDGYLAVGNLTSPLEKHHRATALAALEVMHEIHNLKVVFPEMSKVLPQGTNTQIDIRIGIHSGEVIAGIVGKNRYIFDLWGDAVNIASRMESTSQPGKIHVSDTFASRIINDSEFQLFPRESIEIKGKGMMNTFWLENQK